MTQNLTADKIRAMSPYNSTPLEERLRPETWRRDQLAAVTFGIELRGHSIMLESDWDCIAARIDRTMGTCRPVVDEFFAAEFSPMTTAWIHRHPELDRIGEIFDHYVIAMRGLYDFTRPQYRDLVKRKS